MFVVADIGCAALLDLAHAKLSDHFVFFSFVFDLQKKKKTIFFISFYIFCKKKKDR